MTGREAQDFYIDPDAAFTPPEIDRQMRLLSNELAHAQIALSRARTQETKDLQAYSEAKIRLLMEPGCPVSLDSKGITNTQREEWVNAHIPDLWWTCQESRNLRQGAWDYCTRLDVQVRLLQSISKNARQAYEIAREHQ